MGAFNGMLVRQLADIAGVPADTDLKVMLRRAKRATHPDVGGSTEAMQRVHTIEGLLRDRGVLA